MIGSTDEQQNPQYNQADEATACGKEEILVPKLSEIEAAQSIAHRLSEDLMRQVTIIAVILFGSTDAQTIQ